MPSFDYECPNQHRFECLFLGTETAPPIMRCDSCDEPATRQVAAPSRYWIEGNNGASVTPIGQGHAKKESK